MLTDSGIFPQAWNVALAPRGDDFAQPSTSPRRGAPGERGSRRVRSVLETAGLLAAPPRRFLREPE
jgi:hypothetical protein